MDGLKVLELESLPRLKHCCRQNEISISQGQVIIVPKTFKQASETISKLKSELKIQFFLSTAHEISQYRNVLEVMPPPAVNYPQHVHCQTPTLPKQRRQLKLTLELDTFFIG